MLTSWRILVVASALTGVGLAAAQYDVWWTALSQLASLAVGAVWLGLVVGPAVTGGPPARAAWLRGALATVMALVSLAFVAMQHGNLLDPYSILEHLLTPALVVADVTVVARLGRVPWWAPLTWALVPLPYLAWYVLGDLRVYAALDVDRPGVLGLEVAALLALVLVAGYALRAVGARGPRPVGLGLPAPDTI